jgi:beta-1,4-mannosyl-glycoprotein beta-1,4-N-acetylglucosaminyltransferase
MKTYDCFTFYNEEEMLKIRLNELYEVVDYFFIVEADRTFTGKTKSFYIDKYDWLDKFKHKIIRSYVSLHDKIDDPWGAEHKQRNSISDVLNYADDMDFCIISDVDEIPRPDVVASSRICFEVDSPVKFDVKQYFWNFNWLTPAHCNNGGRPVMCRAKDLRKKSAQEMRSDSKIRKIPDAGWHFSFFMNYNDIVNKIESFAHTEYDLQEYKDLENIRYRIENGIDPFDRFPLKYTSIDKSYPKYVQENYIDG